MNRENSHSIVNIDIPILRNESHNFSYSAGDNIFIDNNNKYIIDIFADKTKYIRFLCNDLLFCVSGELHMLINGVDYHLKENCIMVIPYLFDVQLIDMSVDLNVINFFLSNRVIQAYLGKDIDIWNQLIYKSKIKTIPIHDKHMQMVASFFEVIKHVNEDTNPYVEKMYRLNINIILYMMLHYYSEMDEYNKNIYNGIKNGNGIFNNFLKLLTESKPKRHSVKYFADKLNISSKYLTIVCKQNSNRTALEWIHEYINEEIRYYLDKTDIEIKNIVDLTGFDSLSFFCSYVKEHLGCTPMEYRKRKH